VFTAWPTPIWGTVETGLVSVIPGILCASKCWKELISPREYNPYINHIFTLYKAPYNPYIELA
jgi:hypothetical protein